MKMPERKFHKLPHLVKGDTIGIVAPAWSFDRKQFLEAVDSLQSWGYRVKYDSSIFDTYRSMAGHDAERAAQLEIMFSDSDVKAILCANAGYGSIRTIPFIRKRTIRDNPKIFVGYSDITILLSFLQRVAHMVVFHGPVLAGEVHRDMNPENTQYLLKAVGSTTPLGVLCFPSLKRVRDGKARGVLAGGNLSMIISSLGTPYEVDTEGSILFLEEIGESLEVIDNHLMQLKLAGKLKRVRGVIFGRILDFVDDPVMQQGMHDILDDIFERREIPILYGFPAGHRRLGDVNVTLPFGVQVDIDGNELSVTFIESGVF
jgi:muramoyltetrapeptide carboxypeptidase